MTEILSAALTVLFALACSPSFDGSANHATEPGAERIHGHVTHVSDVSSIEDSRYSSGVVLAIGNDAWKPMADSLEIGTRTAGFEIPEDGFRKAVAGSAPLGRDGTFSISVPPGSYMICVANLGESSSAPPAYVYGCAELELLPRTVRSVYFRNGEGGLTYTEG